MLEHLPKHSEQTSDQHGTFPISSHQYSGAPGMSITISNHHRTLKRVTLRFGKYARHRRDSSPTNDQQRDLNGHADPYAFQKIFCRWTVNTMSYSLCFAILAVSEIWSSVSPYPVQSRYRHSLFTRSVIFHPRDLVTCCAASDVISSSGPRVSLHHAEEQILLLIKRLNLRSLEYLKDAFQTTHLRCSHWRNQGSRKR